MLLLLDDDTLAGVLQHCSDRFISLKHAAVACRRLRDVARSGTSYNIHVNDARLPQLPSICASTAPFTGCTSLKFSLTYSATALLDGQTIAAGLAAPGRWPNLKKLDLSFEVYDSYYEQNHHADVDQYAGHLISSLGSLQQLRELELRAPVGPCCLASLRAATHLTRLHLGMFVCQETYPAYVPCLPRDLFVLSALSNLKRLTLDRCGEQRPPAAGNSSSTTSSSSSRCRRSCLPSSLVALDCTLQGQKAVYWLHHLAGCPGLEQLSVAYHYHMRDSLWGRSLEGSVLDLAAQHTTRLTSLHISHQVGTMGCGSVMHPSPTPQTVGLPPSRQLAQLTRLQQLELSGCVELVVTTHQEWGHLGCLQALKRVSGLHIKGAPPAGVQLPHLEVVSASVVRLCGADTALLLAACPALKAAVLEVAAEDEGGSSSGGGMSDDSSSSSGDSCDRATDPSSAVSTSAAGTGLGPSSALRTMDLTYNSSISAEVAATHFAAAAVALAGLSRLDVTWPGNSSTFRHLPDFSSLAALTHLRLRSHQDESVQEEDLLLALQPLGGTLQELELSNFSRVTPGVVLALQGLLPILQVFGSIGCGRLTPVAALETGNSEHQQLQLLKGHLRPGLTLRCRLNSQHDWFEYVVYGPPDQG